MVYKQEFNTRNQKYQLHFVNILERCSFIKSATKNEVECVEPDESRKELRKSKNPSFRSRIKNSLRRNKYKQLSS